MRTMLYHRTSTMQTSRSSVHRTSEPSHGGPAPSVLGIRVRLPESLNLECAPGCLCTCHSTYHFRSPQVLDRILGACFVGYCGFPFQSRQSCTDVLCRAQRKFRTRVNYFFPSWFVSKMMAINVMGTFSGEISMCLSVRGVLAPSANVFRLVLHDDYDGLRRLYSTRSACPNDVVINTERTALHVSSCY